MTIFARSSHERPLLGSPPFLQVWQPIDVCRSLLLTESNQSRLHAHSHTFRGFLPVEVFNDIVRGLFTPFFSAEKFRSLHSSCAHGNWPIRFPLNSLWLVIASWWPTQLKTQRSALITLHMLSIALISWSAWSKPNYITACGTGTHGPPSDYDNHVPIEAGQNFCSLGNRPMQKWWNCSAHSCSPPWFGKAVPPPVAYTAPGTMPHACGAGVSPQSYTFCSTEYL